MRMLRLGSSGPEVSVIGFGAWEAGGKGWGKNPPDEEVISAIHAAIDAGVNWIDTAEIYGGGASEKLVGRALDRRRSEMLIATKVAPRGDGTGFRAKDVRRAVEGSLHRLRTDYIDLYQLHWPDAGVPIEETWTAMAELADRGVVRSIGVSNFGRRLIESCERIRHVDSSQPHFSLLHPKNRDLIRWCGERGIGVVPYSPLGCGLLSGAITAETKFARNDWRNGTLWESELYDQFFAPGRIEQSLSVAKGLRAIAARTGATMSQLALAWNLAQPGVTSPIAGTRNADHIREDAGAADLVLDDETLSEIENLIELAPKGDEAD
ncbi:MAG: aldo/keto reductase [Actinomycetota bacterium]